MTVLLTPQPKIEPEVHYPDSDGEPMAENTEQFDWIALLKHNIDILFAQNPDVFVAADLFWYPVEGDNRVRLAPDVMVAIGRSKGRRGSYMQWQEGNQPPQVVFEILPPGNRLAEMLFKFSWYERYGAEEYYVYNPDTYEFAGALRVGDSLVPTENLNGFVSPRLGIRFELPPNAPLVVQYPDSRPFLMPIQIADENARLREKMRLLGIDPDAV